MFIISILTLRIYLFAHSLNVRDVLQEMEKVQLKGEAGEEELKALEMDMTGKMLLASWRGARLEVIQVLREVQLLLMHSVAESLNFSLSLFKVVDQVLKDPSANDSIILNRAKVSHCTLPCLDES